MCYASCSQINSRKPSACLCESLVIGSHTHPDLQHLLSFGVMKSRECWNERLQAITAFGLSNIIVDRSSGEVECFTATTVLPKPLNSVS